MMMIMMIVKYVMLLFTIDEMEIRQVLVIPNGLIRNKYFT